MIRTRRVVRRRQQRGWVMLTVLLVLLALGFVVTAFYTQSEDHLFMGNALGGYSMAAARAEAGAQFALAQIRSSNLNVGSLTVMCNDAPPADPYTACAANMLTNPNFPQPENPNPGLDLKMGGGLQYRYVVYKPNTILGANNTGVVLYTIRSTGYYGYSMTSPNLYTSEVEVTVEVGTANKFNCTSYDCS